MPNKPIERIKYTDGSNGIVRLPPELWKAFYDAAIYLDYASVQDCFIDYLKMNFPVFNSLDWASIVERIEARWEFGDNFDELPF